MAMFVVCDAVTGEVLRGGEAPANHVAAQAQEGEVAYEVPIGVLAWPTIDLEPLRAQLRSKIDSEAGAVRRRFITDITGQEATYLAKEAEANAWTAEADPATFPYLTKEAAKKGQAVSDLVTEILAIAAFWRSLDPEIESSRVAAKAQVSSATTIPDIYAAGNVDWEALLP